MTIDDLTKKVKKIKELLKIHFHGFFFFPKKFFLYFFSITIRSKTDRDSGRMNNLEASQVRIKKRGWDARKNE